MNNKTKRWWEYETRDEQQQALADEVDNKIWDELTMKKIIWNSEKCDIVFDVTSKELRMIKTMFTEKRMKLIPKEQIRGFSADMVMVDQISRNDNGRYHN